MKKIYNTYEKENLMLNADKSDPKVAKIEAEIEAKYAALDAMQKEKAAKDRVAKIEKDAKENAETSRIFYQAYIDAGFTPDVALILLRDLCKYRTDMEVARIINKK